MCYVAIYRGLLHFVHFDLYFNFEYLCNSLYFLLPFHSLSKKIALVVSALSAADEA